MKHATQEVWTAKEYQDFLKTKKKPTKGNKYGAVRAEFDGRNFDSTGERDYAVELDLMKKAGLIKRVQYQYKIVLESDGKFIANYYIDFRVILPDGSVELIEFKGKELPDFKIKWQLVKAQLQEIEPNAVLKLVKKIGGKFETVEVFTLESEESEK